jgi:redox-sensitive bicupin YhaK (pirin superfamily)
MSIRPIVETRTAQPTMEGAGVHLHRAFGFQDPTELDPFLLFDDFRNDDPAFYRQGLSLAPASGDRDDHLRAGGHGRACRQPREHGQAGRGLGPVDDGGLGHPASGDAARERQGADARVPAVGEPAGVDEDDGAAVPGHPGADIPEVTDDDGTHVRVITGEFWGKKGPVDGIAADPQYLDISVPAGVRKTFRIDTYRRAFAYVFQGAGAFSDASAPEGVLLEKEVMGQEVNIRDCPATGR